MAFADLKKRAMTGFPLAAGYLLIIAFAAYSCIGSWILGAVGVLAVGLAAGEFVLFWSRFSRRSAAIPSSLERLIEPAGAFLALCFPALGVAYICITQSAQGYACKSIAATQGLFAGTVLGFVTLGTVLSLLGRVSREGVERFSSGVYPAFALIGVGGGAMTALAFSAQAPYSLVWLTAVVCLNDIAAYFFGAKIGGPKLSSHLSPGKTVSGSFAGFIIGVLTGVAVGKLIPDPKSTLVLVLLSLLVVLAAQGGDLLKSYLKRVAGVKDSGTLLPGHGGVLDRLDGILAAAPIVVFFW